jgi:hypothetical protein
MRSPRHSWIAARWCIYQVRSHPNFSPTVHPIHRLAGYTYDEKLHIASRFLLPKQLKANGLDASRIVLAEPAMLQIVTGYTREAGVRSLERAIGSVVRHKAVEWAEHDDDEDGDKLSAYEKEVREEDLEEILGIPRYDGEKDRTLKRGIVYGLVVSGLGEGGVLPVETCTIPGRGDLRLTGSLGDVSSISSPPPFTLGTRLKPCANCTGYQGEQLLGPELGKDARLRFTDNFKSQRRPAQGSEPGRRSPSLTGRCAEEGRSVWLIWWKRTEAH